MGSAVSSMLWFAAIVAMIPLALWLLKRTPLASAQASGVMRTVAAVSISPSQRLVTVEVGEGDDRRWLVLGVTAQTITTLHTMVPQVEPARAVVATTPFAALYATLRNTTQPKGSPGAV